ncbi:MAG TPA: RloB family protein [Puia sp.]|uniref:RloB family protein n=1 Tax=Puia sp. TaxID=2045100 RepID=UPI002B7A9D05|nr:RloB family protein [Puia sp.]HVU95286.1 RloB family protein [Puia sp.]
MARKGKLASAPRDEEERPVRLRRYRYLLLIVCEDQKTEKHYFEGFKPLFPERTIYQRTVGTGLDPKGVVERALTEREALQEEAGKEVDKTWVVFDKDDADISVGRRARYETALALARESNLTLADSNECFEVWPLLHFQDIPGDKPIPRQQVYQLIQDAVRLHPDYGEYTYLHGSTEILDILVRIGDERLAIERAKALLVHHNQKPRIECNPSTQVHLLVEDLRAWIAYYSYIPDNS